MRVRTSATPDPEVLLALERVHRRRGARPRDAVDLRQVEAVRAQRDLQACDLRVDRSVRGGRRGQRDRCGGDRDEAAHEPDSFRPGAAVPAAKRR